MIFGVRPFERHCPSIYVRYLENLPLIASTKSNNYVSACDNVLDATVPDASMSQKVVKSRSSISGFNLPVSFDEETKQEDYLPAELKIRIPLNDALLISVSLPLRKLLKQLFDPRPWIRVTWSSFDEFMRHEWFALYEVSVADINAQRLSPAFVSSERVNMRNIQNMSQVSMNSPLRQFSKESSSAKMENMKKREVAYGISASMNDPFAKFYFIGDDFKDIFSAYSS
jgi:hypothetical protein